MFHLSEKPRPPSSVRAVTPGTYIHPAAQVEDMYRPQFSARTAAGFVEVRELR